MDSMLSRPYFVCSELISPLADTAWDVACILALKSAVELAERRVADAMATACDTVELGLRWMGARELMPDSLSGQVIIVIGLERVRAVAMSSQVRGEILNHALDRLDMEQGHQQAYVAALGTQFHELRDILQESDKLGLPRLLLVYHGDEMPLRSPPELDTLLSDQIRALKLNMTVNMFGEHFRMLVRQSQEHYSLGHKVLPGPNTKGFSDMFRQEGVFDSLRNPIGITLLSSLKSLYRHTVVEHFSTRAHIRAARLLLALRSYHLENGRLPERLDVLSPDYIPQVPADPFGGASFVYEPSALVPCLYSVGLEGRKPGELEELHLADVFIRLDIASPGE